MSTGTSLAVISLNEEGRSLTRRLYDTGLDLDSYIKLGHGEDPDPSYKERPLVEGRARATIEMAFENYDCLVCIMASGIVVRCLVGLLDSKFTDPAVLVMDEKGDYVISLLSGHFGRANAYARDLAVRLGARPVITTSTDKKDLVGLDVLALDNDLDYRNKSENTLTFNSLLSHSKTLGLYNKEGLDLKDTRGYRIIEDLNKDRLKGLDGLVVISNEKNIKINFDGPVVKLVKKSYALGMGCKKNTPYHKLKEALEAYTDQVDIDPLAIGVLASIDIKKDEEAFKTLAQDLGLSFICYSKENLEPYEGFYPGSDFVKKTVGVSSVAQPASHRASGSRCFGPRFSLDGVTLALSKIKEDKCYTL